MPHLSKLRICFVAGTLGQGGAERQLYYMARTLIEVGCEVHVLSLTQGEFWEDKLRQIGVPVYWIGKSGNRLRRLAHIIRTVRRLRPHILQSQNFYMNAYAAAAARLLCVREIGAVRNDGQSEWRDGGTATAALSFHVPRLLAANSRLSIRNLIRRGIEDHQLFFLPNVVDLGHFHQSACGSPCNKPERQLRSSANSHVNLLAVGRLACQKRFDRLFRAISRVQAQTSTTILLHVVGDGPERDILLRLADTLNLLPNTVRFHGPVDDVLSFYRRADFLVLTSDWEGTPNVLLEAMACNLPVLATAVGGVPDLVIDGCTGLLVEPTNEEQLDDKMLELINDSALRQRLGNAARAHVEENYSLQRLPYHLATLYSAALGAEVTI